MKARSHLKNRILVQGRGGDEFQTAGILEYFEDLKRVTNKDIDPPLEGLSASGSLVRLWRVGPKDIFEMASKLTAALTEPQFDQAPVHF